MIEWESFVDGVNNILRGDLMWIEKNL
jgi:hypothetical protein